MIALAAIYAQEVIGFSTRLGAFCFSYVPHRIDHVRAIALTLCGWLLIVSIA